VKGKEGGSEKEKKESKEIKGERKKGSGERILAKPILGPDFQKILGQT